MSIQQSDAQVSPSVRLAERVLAGSKGAVARMLTLVERRSPGVDEAMAVLHQHTGGAHVIGITGSAGSGKSTLVSALAAEYRARGSSVGILAVDPSSAYSGGAILGDRIRMSELALDPEVYIRSLATRGAMGGLSRAALDGIDVLDAAGADIVLLETVGVGQAEVDVITVAQSVAVVSVPGMGDEVQAIKAGLLEVADVHVVNKADRPGAQRTVSDLREVLRLSKRHVHQWNVPIEQTVASTGEGVTNLVDVFTKHRAWLHEHGQENSHERRNAVKRILWAAEEIVTEKLRPGLPEFDAAVEDVVARKSDPATTAKSLINVADRPNGPHLT